ncbi:unnamed protein product, partial [Gongylonema pulchrum]
MQSYRKNFCVIFVFFCAFQDLCSSHYGASASVWALQKTLTNSSKCIHKLHTLPCHNILTSGYAQELYQSKRVAPRSCGGLFGAPMPYEHITSERDVRAPQVTNDMLKRHYSGK